MTLIKHQLIKCIAFLGIFFLLCAPLHAQSNEWSLSIDTLLTAANKYLRVNPDTAIARANKALVLAQKHNLAEATIKANISLGKAYDMITAYPKALQYLETALKGARKIKDEDLELTAWVEWAFMHERVGEFQLAIDELLKANALAQKLGDKKQMAKINSNLARVHLNYNALDKAIEFLSKAKSIFEEIGEVEALPSLNNNLAILYQNADKDEEAIAMLVEAANASLKVEDELGAADTYSNLGFMYIKKNQLDTAENYLLQSMKIHEKFKQESPHNSLYLAQLYVNKGAFKQAEKYALQGLAYSKAQDMKYEITSSHELLAKTYAVGGDYQKAYTYQLEFDKGKEELFNADKSKAVELIENKLEIQQKEVALLQVNQENERRKYWNIGLITLGVFSGILGLLFFRQRTLKNREERLLLEQRLLRSQMSPHFIFNALSSIQGFILKNNNKTAGSYLAKFSRLIRMILENSRREYVALDEEITTLENYLDLQQLRFPNKFNYEIKVDEQLNTEEIAIPPLLAQPFIENAIEHGIQHKEGEGFLSIYFNWEKGALQFKLEDNGIGRAEAAILKEGRIPHQSLSTQITKERLQVYQNKTQKSFSLEIKDKLGRNQKVIGTSVQIQLPFKEWIRDIIK